MTDEMIIRSEGAAGFLTLNRPKAIHALTQAMDHAMTEALLAWTTLWSGRVGTALPESTR
mgnify:CR=1 FL=1